MTINIRVIGQKKIMTIPYIFNTILTTLLKKDHDYKVLFVSLVKKNYDYSIHIHHHSY